MNRLAFGTLMLCSMGAAQAGDFAVGASVGTPGVGLQGTYGLSESLNLRGAINFFETDFDESSDGIDYNLDLDLGSAGVLLDWHPGGGSFRISGGVFANGNDVSGSGRGPAGTQVEFGDQTFDADDLGRVDAEMDFDSVAPYLGIGLGNAVKDAGLSFSLDVGVYFQGEPDVTLSTPDIDPLLDPLLAAAVEAERQKAEAELQDEVDSLDLYPYISLGVAYRF